MMIGSSINIDFSRVWEWMPTFLDGTIVTIVLSITTVFIGSLIGLFVVLMKMSDYKILNWIANVYTNIVRGTPVLLQLFLWLYGFPMIGLTFTGIGFLGGTYGSREFITAVVALSINSGAYVSEILRGGLEAVDKGQIEAGRALGLSRRETMFSVVIPQAIRTVLPGLGNEFIVMIKESSIVSTVGVFDVMYTSNIVQASTYSIFEPLIVVGVIYYILTYSLSYLMRRLEKRLNTYA
ncbi:amino acid ABC transporter permease [Carnobacteriaceae bacterium 52-44]|jgi:amine acid ABC transporter, permease protein, 3-TM region, His/Glu/Gln/Arg/opine family